MIDGTISVTNCSSHVSSTRCQHNDYVNFQEMEYNFALLSDSMAKVHYSAVKENIYAILI